MITPHDPHLYPTFLSDQPSTIYLDTETTGLDMIKDKPFLVAVGWGEHIFITSADDKNLQLIFDSACLATVWVWNAKYDAHMLYNVGYRIPWTKWNDGMAVAMLAGYTDQTYRKMALKTLANDLLGLWNPIVKEVETNFTKLVTQHKRNSFHHQGYSFTQIEKMAKKIDFDMQDLPPAVQVEWEKYHTEPQPTYADLDQDLIYEYVKNDIVIMKKLIEHLLPIVKKRQQIDILAFEQTTLEPFWDQERRGVKINRDYLLTVKKAIQSAVKRGRKQLYQLLGMEINVNQHTELKTQLNRLYNLKLRSVSKDSLKRIRDTTKNTNLQTIAKYILRLRSLEKWYSTYCVRFLEGADENNIIRSSFNLFSSKTGRITSDLHQFPHMELKDFSGDELFNVRKMIIPFQYGLAFFDYSEMELRIQAEFTQQLKNPDPLLCEAYRGKTPIDVHARTASIFFGEQFAKKYRRFGKQIMFAFIYGASAKGIHRYIAANMAIATPLFSHIQNLYQDLKRKYHGITIYQRKVAEQINLYRYYPNLYQRRYYFYDNHKSLYKAYNFLIQGSGAYILKAKVVEIYQWLKKHHKQSFIFLTIHDEIVLSIHQDEINDLAIIWKMLETFPQFQTPMKVNLATTKTNWAEKKEVVK